MEHFSDEIAFQLDLAAFKSNQTGVTVENIAALQLSDLWLAYYILIAGGLSAGKAGCRLQIVFSVYCNMYKRWVYKVLHATSLLKNREYVSQSLKKFNIKFY